MTRRPLGGTVGRTLEETEPREVLGCENVVFESKGVRDETGPEEGQESFGICSVLHPSNAGRRH